MADLSTKLGELVLKNPIIAAGGPLAGTVEHIKDCVDAGFGAVVTKTASTVWYLQRYPRPLYVLLDYKKNPEDPYYVPNDYFWQHREHNSVYPPLQFAQIIKEASPYAKEKNCKIIGSFSCKTTEEWIEIARAYEEAGCDALEINFCCPFPPEGLSKDTNDNHVGIYYTKNPEKAVEIIKILKKEVKIPLFVKLSPDGHNFDHMAVMLKDAGASGVTMFANNKTLRIDIETGKPEIFGPGPGTGPGLKSLSLRWVAEVSKACGDDFGVMGNRGASLWSDAIEFMMAGSSAVQYCTPIMIRGLKYAAELLSGMEKFLDRKGYAGISEIKGMAMRQIYDNQEMVDKVKPLYATVNPKKCVSCKRCTEVCFYDAMVFGKVAAVKTKNCSGCSLCSQVCPVNAIHMSERDNDIDHFRALASAHGEILREGFFEET